MVTPRHAAATQPARSSRGREPRTLAARRLSLATGVLREYRWRALQPGGKGLRVAELAATWNQRKRKRRGTEDRIIFSPFPAQKTSETQYFPHFLHRSGDSRWRPATAGIPQYVPCSPLLRACAAITDVSDMGDRHEGSQPPLTLFTRPRSRVTGTVCAIVAAFQPEKLQKLREASRGPERPRGT
jgi:hypothetical protein